MLVVRPVEVEGEAVVGMEGVAHLEAELAGGEVAEDGLAFAFSSKRLPPGSSVNFFPGAYSTPVKSSVRVPTMR